jgi:Transposase DDE domain group 1
LWGPTGAAMADPTGEADRGALRLDFDRRLVLEFRGSAITSDAGLLPYRELDDAVGLTDTGAEMLADARTGKNGRHRLAGLLRQSVFGRLAGYEDVNDAARLRRDPVMRWVVGDRAISGSAASASQMGRFETKWLSRPENLGALADLPGQWIDKVHQRRLPKIIVLDMDSSESPDLRRAGRNRLQRPFRLHLLSPTIRVQPVRRCRAMRPAIRQRAQRRRLARSPGTSNRALPGHREASLFPRRRGLRQSRDVRVP